MVYTNRTEKCISQDKGCEKPSSKFQSSSSHSYSSTSGSSSSSSTSVSKYANNNPWSKSASDADKWKYNNMVRDNRDHFNSMHFC
ncbi:putative uncharacterized protein DDB_G0281733 [Stomoxys calcitrans]|uniref:Uncharacterized protein n=1 Tax=Stomoxys calcitrans TaxID=35570 RepID=A0A1I8PDX7_STOCA|nr:putative uncharacterized protein DDB_G0281733 [Stomoxys calcitrans]